MKDYSFRPGFSLTHPLSLRLLTLREASCCVVNSPMERPWNEEQRPLANIKEGREDFQHLHE